MVFEDDNIIVFHRHISDTLIISFGERGFVSTSESWGSKVFLALGLSSIGYVSKRPNWYPVTSMRRSIEAIQYILDGYDCRVSYGHSQGGYGAIKYSSALGVRTVLSFCPQVSIDPDDLDQVDRRFSRFFSNKIEHKKISRGDVINEANVFVFYDPTCELDKFNIRKISASIPALREVKVFGTDHSSVKPFASKKAVGELIALALQDNLPGIKQLNYRCKKTWRERRTFLARSLSIKKLNLALKVLAGSHAQLTKESAPVIVYNLSLAGKYQYLSEFGLDFYKDLTEAELKPIFSAMLAADNLKGALALNSHFLVKSGGRSLFSNELTPKLIYPECEWVHFCEGWSSYEKYGVWGVSRRSKIIIDWDKVPRYKDYLRIRYSQVVAERLRIWVTACTDNFPVDVEPESNEYFRVHRSGRITEIEFNCDDLVCPAAEGMSIDRRYLGVSLSHPRTWLM